MANHSGKVTIELAALAHLLLGLAVFVTQDTADEPQDRYGECAY